MPSNGVPSSVPLRSFGGASAGSASPFAFAQSRAVAPAASQTALAAPRVDPLQSSEWTAQDQSRAEPGGYASAPGALGPSPSYPLSPFSAPVDLSAALGAFGAASRAKAPRPRRDRTDIGALAAAERLSAASRAGQPVPPGDRSGGKPGDSPTGWRRRHPVNRAFRPASGWGESRRAPRRPGFA